MSSIRITVGAQADASFSRVFAPLLAASAAARAKVTSDANAMAATQRRAAKTGADAQEREAKRVANAASRSYQSIEAMSAKAASKEAADAHRAAQAKVAAQKREFDSRLRAAQKAKADETKAADKAAKDIARLAARAERESQARARREAASAARLEQQKTRAQMREFDSRARESKRAKEREERDIIRTARRAEAAELRQFERSKANALKARTERFKDIARGSMDNLKSIGRGAMDLGQSGFRAAGVQFDPSTLMQRAIDLESSVTSTTISAMTGKSKVATASDIGDTMSAVKAAGNVSKQDYGAIAAGLSDFVSKSGDLETGKVALADLGLIARATGADVGDLISAAGDVSKTLGGVGEGERFATAAEKAELLLRIMRLVAKQGAMGSVEIKDLAKYMGNVTASAFMFEGSIDDNMGILGGLAQTAMKGGAVSAAEGTRAANAFSRDITKQSALKRFEDAGINVFADKDRKKLLSPEKIITQFLRTTGGSLDELSSLFQNEMSKKVLKGYSQIYDEKGGGEAGIAAVEAEFRRMSKGMSQKEVRAAAGVSMGGKAARAQEFQNKLEDLGMELADKLLPALMKLTPKILELADALVKLIGWATDNPNKAMGAAVGVAVGGSILKTAVGGAAAGALSGAMGAGAGKLGAGALAGAAGGAGLLGAGALALGGLGLAGWQGYELYKNARVEGSGDTFWKELKHDLGFMSDKDYENSFGIRTGAAAMSPPPTAPQPAGAPPVVTAPPPNPVPTLQGIAEGQRSQTAALQEIAKNTAAQAAAGPSVNSAGRTGPAPK